MGKLIGLTGQMGSGKDTVAQFIIDNTAEKCQTFSFADPLKQALSGMLQEPLDFFEDRTLKELESDVIPGHTRRELMQWFGTDVGRKNFGEDFWIRVADQRIRRGDLKVYNNLIQTSIRFDNEADWIRSLGGSIVHVIRKSNPHVTNSSHSSEKPVKTNPRDYVLFNNGSLEDLENETVKIINDLRI